MKLENVFKAFGFCCLFIGGQIIEYLGGADSFLIILMIALILDLITGVCKAIINKKLSSDIGFKGILRKFLTLLLVFFATSIEKYLTIKGIRETVILYYIVNNSISIIENIVDCGLPVPQKFKSIFENLIEKETKENEKNT